MAKDRLKMLNVQSDLAKMDEREESCRDSAVTLESAKMRGNNTTSATKRE
jgi:hypothetical protein